MRIVVFEVEEWEHEAFDALRPEHDLTLRHEELNADSAADYAQAQVISPFIYSELDENTLRQLPDLQLIATRSTGFDHIDLDYCEEHAIAVCNVPEYGDTTVAEHVFALLLAISHRIVEAADRTRRGDFSLQGLRGFDVRGKRLGVIGTGSIGRCVITIATGFGMEVVAFDVKPNQEAAERLGYRYVDMEELLRTADVITLHVPANKHTYHLLSNDEFDQMKDGVVLINTARGSLIDVRALARALAEKKVVAAGLDVLPEEPTIREEIELLHSVYREEHDLQALLADQVLLRLRNVIITPHSAFYTREALERILNTSVDNIQAFARGQPQNVVTDTGSPADE